MLPGDRTAMSSVSWTRDLRTSEADDLNGIPTRAELKMRVRLVKEHPGGDMSHPFDFKHGWLDSKQSPDSTWHFPLFFRSYCAGCKGLSTARPWFVIRIGNSSGAMRSMAFRLNCAALLYAPQACSRDASNQKAECEEGDTTKEKQDGVHPVWFVNR
jgi:hypothetical protein